MTYQTISQLGGSIEIGPRDPAASPPGTVMEVRLPYVREEPSRGRKSGALAPALQGVPV